MQSVLAGVGAVYFLLVVNFYNESHGFTKSHTAMYAIWKVIPIVFLTIFAAVHGGGLPRDIRFICATALLLGGVGDVLIALSPEGIISGALVFGIGHLLYMTQFLSNPTKIYWPLLIGTLVWGSVVARLCLFPMLHKHQFAFVVMSVYSVLLSACLIVTGSQYINRQARDDEQGLFLRFIGFLLFYISDSVLILLHTGYKTQMSDAIVLGTYYAAQYLILYGNIYTGVRLKSKLN